MERTRIAFVGVGNISGIYLKNLTTTFKNEVEIAGVCDKCALEIYDSDVIYIIDGFVICDECFESFSREYFEHCKAYGEILRRIK